MPVSKPSRATGMSEGTLAAPTFLTSHQQALLIRKEARRKQTMRALQLSMIQARSTALPFSSSRITNLGSNAFLAVFLAANVFQGHARQDGVSQEDLLIVYAPLLHVPYSVLGIQRCSLALGCDARQLFLWKHAMATGPALYTLFVSCIHSEAATAVLSPH